MKLGRYVSIVLALALVASICIGLSASVYPVTKVPQLRSSTTLSFSSLGKVPHKVETFKNLTKALSKIMDLTHVIVVFKNKNVVNNPRFTLMFTNAVKAVPKTLKLSVKGLKVEKVKFLKHVGMAVVKFSKPITLEDIAKLSKYLKELYGSNVVGVFPNLKFYVQGIDTKKVIRGLNEFGGWIIYKKYNLSAGGGAYPLIAYGPDPLFSWQWNLNATGAIQAWRITEGEPNVVVAVLDTGVAFHPDLVFNIWTNSKETPFNGVDDDNNGYPDDYWGYDVANDDPLPWDTVGHGTFIAGVIAAAANNTIGIAGIAPKVKVLAVKIFPDYQEWTTDVYIIEGIDYILALKNKSVNIVAVTGSWGMCIGGILRSVVLYSSYPLYLALKKLGDAGILFVSAAGNSQIPLNDEYYTCVPQNFYLPNKITVSAIDPAGTVPYWSNTEADIAAPGDWITSTYAESTSPYRFFLGYAIGAGTSFSVPHVAAAAALLASLYEEKGIDWRGNLSVALKMNLMFGAQPCINITSKTPFFTAGGQLYCIKGVVHSGYLNISKAMELALKNPNLVSMIPLSPKPYYEPNASSIYREIMYKSLPNMAIPANISVPMKVMVGTPLGPLKGLEVRVVFNNQVIGILNDSGNYPDAFANDGVYTGFIKIPYNASYAGKLVIQPITLQVVNTTNSAVILQSTYYYPVIYVPAYYTAKVANYFLWVNISNKSPMITVGFQENSHVLITPTTPLKLFGLAPSYLVEYSEFAYPSLLNGLNTVPTTLAIVSSSQVVTGLEPSQEWSEWSLISLAGIVLPSTLYGVSFLLYPYAYYNYTYVFSEEYPPIMPYYSTTACANTVIDNETAMVCKYTIKMYEGLMVLTPFYGYAYIGPYTGVSAELETIFFSNGTIAVSILKAPASGYSYVEAFNKYLSASVDLSQYGVNGTVQNLTIVYEPVYITPPPTIPATPVQFGYITMNTTPIFVNFTKNFTNPVVVLGPVTYNGWQPCEAYVLNVNSTGFYTRIYEFNYEDGWHVTEKVGYLVVEAGVHTLPDGRVVEAGYVNASTGKWVWVSFPKPFEKMPIVIASLASRYTNVTVVPRIKGINATGFWIELEPQESLIGKAAITEKVAWIAVEPGTSSFALAGTIKMPATTLPKITITFNASFTKTPVVLATAQTFNGPDPFVLRLTAVNATQATVMMQEDQSKDGEQWHVSETIGYLVISRG